MNLEPSRNPEYIESRTYGSLLRDTLNAIDLIKTLGSGGIPDDLQRGLLSQFGGFGPIAEVFRHRDDLTGQNLAARDELERLLTPMEFSLARESVETAYYTPPSYIPLVWSAASRLVGVSHPLVLDPGCGIGNFAMNKPPAVCVKEIYGVEIEPISAAIAKKLAWGRVYNKDFFEWGCPLRFDLAIGNIPFTDGVRAKYKGFDKKVELHARFILRVLDLMQLGGVIALATTTGTLDSTGPNGEYLAFRQHVNFKARFLGAVRLPQGGFNAYKTQACVDIIFLQASRGQPGDPRPGLAWITTAPTEVISHKTNKPCPINKYFVEHPEQMLGELALDRLTGDKAVVLPRPEQDTLTLLGEALDRII